MVITKREDVTKQGFRKTLWRKLRLRASLLLVFIPFGGVVGVRGCAPISVWVGVGGGWGRGGRLFEAGRLVTFSSFRMGAYSRWALIRGWALIRINTVRHFFNLHDSCLGRSRKSLEIQAFCIRKPRTFLKQKFVWKVVFSYSNNVMIVKSQ